MTTTDIFTIIAARDAAPKPRRFSKRRMYQVSLGNGRVSSRLYLHRDATKISRRFNRLFSTDIAYVSAVTTTVEI
jgi:hypothetical protein